MFVQRPGPRVSQYTSAASLNCVLKKGSELPEGDPQRKFKGRHVFLGDQVKDQDFQNAEFEQLGSSPPTFESARAVDALPLVEGYEQTTADATSAYTQTFIGSARGGGTPTWVRIPRHRWPKHWEGKYRDPVVRMALALYGHVDAGGYWEEYCTKNVLKVRLC